MAHAQGSVVLAPGTFKGGLRPYVVVSNEERPYFGEEYTMAVVTTRSRAEAVRLDESGLTEGRLVEYPSYVNPWSLHVVEHRDIDRRVARVTDEILDEVANGCYEFVRRRPAD